MGSTVAAGGKKTKGRAMYFCGVPTDKCGGGLGQLSAAFRGRGVRVHSSPREAFACYRSYLLGQGYEQVGPRDFKKPPEMGEGILTISKQSRFGTKLRPGKAGRNMPSIRTGGFVHEV